MLTSESSNWLPEVTTRSLQKTLRGRVQQHGNRLRAVLPPSSLPEAVVRGLREQREVEVGVEERTQLAPGQRRGSGGGEERQCERGARGGAVGGHVGAP